MDEWGIHHRVLNAVVETKPGTGCYGIMDVYTDRLELRGHWRHGLGDHACKTAKSNGTTIECQQQHKDAASDGLQIVRQTS